MYKHLFGPVPSRRLGMSLGIDLVPKKVCSLNCVYCEVGSTTNLTVCRKEYVKFKDVKEEIIHYFKHNPDPDFVTFSGSGEPTLNISIGNVINLLKEIRKDIPIAVLTNGTLLYSKDVRKSLLNADLIMPSLDAATEDVFKKINRSHKILSVERHIEGLIYFREEFKKDIWLEVFILPEYNDNREELLLLKENIEKIKPDKVQLNTLDRPGVIDGLYPATYKQLEDIVKLWKMNNVHIISSVNNINKKIKYREDIEDTILDTIKRRPCTVEDLSNILNLHVNEINKYIYFLLENKKIIPVKQKRGIFYGISD